MANSAGETDCKLSVSKPAFFQASIPPFKYPKVLSNPTRDKRVMVSSSFPSGVINRIGCFTSLIKAPTHGAKPPCKPMKIDPGRCYFTNSFS